MTNNLKHHNKQLFVHSWELATAVDGPGTRLVFFLQGCQLRCQFCHNPDSWKVATSSQPGNTTTETVDFKTMSFNEVIALILRYKHIFQATGGGVTFSGGEALLQKDVLLDILEFTKSQGIHICLDTAGYKASNITDQFLDCLDLVLLDIKAPSKELYLEVTRCDIFDDVLNFADRLAKRNIKFRWRFVLVPGLTDGIEFLEGIRKVIEKHPSPLDILPFHQMARAKYQEMNINYPLADFKHATEGDVERAKTVLIP